MSDSIAMPPPKGSLGLIAVVLVVDLGLAAAGAVMLGKGLSKDPPRSPAPATAPRMDSPAPNVEPAKPVQKSEVPASATGETARSASASDGERIAQVDAAKRVVAAGVAAEPRSAAREARTSANQPVSDASAASGANAGKAGSKTAVRSPAGAGTITSPSGGPVTSPAGAGPVTSPSGAGPGGTPEDPYKPARAVSIDAEVAQQAASSKSAFDRCAGDAAPAQGSIQIAFQVLGDGRVANAQAVTNSTNNSELARCLVATIGGWRMSAHGGPALDFVRPFSYP